MVTGIVRLTILLENTDPTIWRCVDISADTTLRDLHDVIQAVMGWENAHLYQFEVGGGLLDGLGLGMGSAAPGIKETSLANLVTQGVEQFRYVYDMGDDWGHALHLESAPEADSEAVYPRFIAGAGRCPPEDIGGLPGFYHFLKVMRNTRHPEHRELKEWHGGPFDPKAMDAANIRRRLKELSPRPRPAPPKLRSTKKKSNPSKTP
jgi:hypothetical protein